MRSSAAALVAAAVHASAAAPPTIELNENNVAGSMPTPSGNPKHGVLLVGTLSSAEACAVAAAAHTSATSWTYHHCDFPHASSGNYSCHCYARTDGRWSPKRQNLVDSGYLKTSPTPTPPTPSPPAPGTKCTSNDDCQLNGKCTATGACVCDPAWTGDACELLNLLPATIDAGLQDPLLSSWGGSVLQDPVTGTWHMYAAVIENGCGLKAWRPNSAIGHATSTTGSPTGPYKLELPLIKPHFAHEPVALLMSDGTIAIWHIGAGRNDTGPGSNYAAHCTNHCTGGGHHWQPGTTFYGPTSILHSTSFDGPWTSIDIANCSSLPNCSQCGDSNPAPVLHANGSVGMMWRTSGKGWPTSCMLPASARSWKGPYTFKSSPLDNLFPTWTTTHIEDGHQWIAGEDSANPGSYHAIFHSDVEKSCGGAAGGHGWSSDEGVTWKFSPRNAYGNNVTLVNGTTMTMHQRERPHLVLNQKGQPVALTNGAGWKNDCDAVFTFAQPINTVTLQL